MKTSKINNKYYRKLYFSQYGNTEANPQIWKLIMQGLLGLAPTENSYCSTYGDEFYILLKNTISISSLVDGKSIFEKFIGFKAEANGSMKQISTIRSLTSNILDKMRVYATDKVIYRTPDGNFGEIDLLK